MNDLVINVENLSKVYKLYNSPLDRFKEAMYPFGKVYHKNHFALNNINFNINKGEAIGIVGKNGAGKSTILKIIAGVLSPSEGNIVVNGKVASLLELGAGFNVEYTGYENIFLNATLLGLTDEQINEKLNDIIKFADIGEYIYQPVKTYSSGMFVRLAFAIIANIDADILIIDEALAVGDTLFVQKCMSFIRKFIETKTLLFVSHDNSAVIDLCNKAIWIDNGKVKEIGKPKDVCDNYLHSLTSNNKKIVQKDDISKLNDENVISNNTTVEFASKIEIKNNLKVSDYWTSGVGEIIEVNLIKLNSNANLFKAGEEVKLIIKARIIKDIVNPILGFIFKDSLGRELFGENTYEIIKDKDYLVNADNTLISEFVFNLPMLQNGEYVVMASLASGNPYEHVHHHFVHESLIISVLHEKLVFGLVSIPFKSVKLIKE